MRTHRLMALGAALSLIASIASAQTTTRYAVDVAVMEKGVETASGRATIAEGGQAEILLTGADGQYTFTANLQPEQGDGEEGRLVLEAYLNHDGADLAQPRMVLARGGTARMQIGQAGPDGPGLADGVEMTLSPLP